jgi:endonuclease-3
MGWNIISCDFVGAEKRSAMTVCNSGTSFLKLIYNAVILLTAPVVGKGLIPTHTLNGFVKRNIVFVLDELEKRYGEAIEAHPNTNSHVFEVLIRTILSARTREENTQKASEQLFARARTPRAMLKLKQSELERLVRPAGTYRSKARNIRATCKMLIGEFGGKVPDTMDGLQRLPGVGPKVAAIVLSYGFGHPIIAVDTHVFRISKRLGIVDEYAKPEEVRKQLEAKIPPARRFVVNLGMVNFGREVCKPGTPLCVKAKENCPFSGFCKAYRTKRFHIKPFGNKLSRAI